MDVIASFQAKVENAVAVSGTAFTTEQLRIIKRYTNNVAFSFDLDSAGIKAASRGIELVLQEGMSVNVIMVPEGKDPADCVQSDPKLWENAVRNPKQVMEFYFESAFAKYNISEVEGKKKAAEELLEIISKISNKIEQAHYTQILSEKLNIDEKVLVENLRDMKKSQSNLYDRRNKDEDNIKKINVTDRKFRLQEKLLGFIINYPTFFKENFSESEGLFFDEKLRKIYCLIKGLYSKENKLDEKNLNSLKETLSSRDELFYLWNKTSLEVEMEMEESGSDIYQEASLCLKYLETIKIKKDREKLERDMKIAGKENDYESLKLLTKEYDKCNEKLGKLEEE